MGLLRPPLRIPVLLISSVGEKNSEKLIEDMFLNKVNYKGFNGLDDAVDKITNSQRSLILTFFLNGHEEWETSVE